MKTILHLAFCAAALFGAWQSARAESNPNDNLIYVPVTQCRLVNTRTSTGGNLVANVAQDFYAYGDAAQLSAQGGNNVTGCPDPKAPNGPEPAAIAVNLTAVGTQAIANGNIIAYASGTIATGSVVNFTQSGNIANAAIVPICRGTCPDGKQLALLANFANVPAVVDVLGYFYPKTTNVVTVAKDGGDYLSPLDAMAYLKGLVTADDPNAPSATNPWVIQIDPGTYDLGATPLVLDAPYVTVQGAGSGATILVGEGADKTGTVQIKADAVRLENLAVNVAAGIKDGTAIVADNSSDASDDVPVISKVAASAEGDGQQCLVIKEGGGLSVIGGSLKGEDYGIEANVIGASVLIDGTEVVAHDTGAYIGLGASLIATNSQLTALDAILGDALVTGPLSSVRISHSTLRGGGHAASVLDLASLLQIDQSTIDGPIVDLVGVVRIGASQITGTVTGGVLTKCVASYNGSFQPLTPSCAVAP